MSQQVWYIKEPSLLQAISAKGRSKFAALHQQWQHHGMSERLSMQQKQSNSQ
jgi:hypothetical protein